MRVQEVDEGFFNKRKDLYPDTIKKAKTYWHL
jgi:hypothetical protein